MQRPLENIAPYEAARTLRSAAPAVLTRLHCQTQKFGLYGAPLA